MSRMSELDATTKQTRKKIHYMDIRLFNNAGMRFPTCKANAKLLDLDAAKLPISNDIHSTTCKQCIKIYFKGDRS